MKNKFFVLTVFTGFMIMGCKAASFRTAEKNLEFTGNPTTGYTWLFEIEDPAVIMVDEDIQYLGKDDIVGAPSLFRYKITSLKSGNTTLKFEYRRPWENNPAEKTMLYDITVKDSGKIIIKKRNQ